MSLLSRAFRRAPFVVAVGLATACQSADVNAPTVAAASVLESAVQTTACGPAVRNAMCLSDGAVLTWVGDRIDVAGARGSYALTITSRTSRIEVLDGTPTSAKQLRVRAGRARFTLNSYSNNKTDFEYASGAERDLDFTISAAGISTSALSIVIPGGSHAFTLGPAGAHFGGDEWDFGGDEWDILIGNGVMSISSQDDWESPITSDDSWDAFRGGKPSLQLAYGSGNIRAKTGMVSVINVAPFAATFNIGSTSMSAQTTCGAKFCFPNEPADLLLAFRGTSPFPATLRFPGVNISSVRSW